MQKSSPTWVSKRCIKLSQNLVLTLNKGDNLFILLFYWQPGATEIDLGIFWLKSNTWYLLYYDCLFIRIIVKKI